MYKVGIIGCGNIAYKYNEIFTKWPVTHMSAYNVHPKTTITAVSDFNKENIKQCSEIYNVPNSYTDHKKMLENEKLDIVSICTPCETHAEIIRDIAKYKVKAIFCEKPFTNNLDDAKEVTSLCKSKGILLVVNFQRRHDLFYQYVKDNMTQLVGDVKKVIFTYSGGVVNNGSHAFDLLNYYFGDIEELNAEIDDSTQIDNPNLSVFIKFKSGIRGLITTYNISNHSCFGMSIIGTKAKLDLINKPFFGYDYCYFKHQASDTLPSVTIASSKPEYPISKELERDLFVKAVDDIIKSIEEDKTPVSSAENASNVLKIVLSSIVSARENRKICAPFNETFPTLSKVRGLFKEWKKN
jgi:predicted dehydrogenase